jgi:hypothetical protein
MRRSSLNMSHVFRSMLLVAAGVFVTATASFAAQEHSTNTFAGVKANTGTAIHFRQGDRQVLRVSDDFQIPDTPAPHWQVVDSRGNTHLLQQLKIKDGKFNRQIVLPPYIRDVAKVQIWCSWAEALLGEASFPTPVK